VDMWAAPPELPSEAAGPARWKTDLPLSVGVVVGCVLLGAPAGLLWSAVAPRITVEFSRTGPQVPDLQSSKAFIGADGSFLVIALLVGALCGALAWWFARRGGPWTVGGLVVGGLLAGVVATRVGLMPGTDEVLAALRDSSRRTSGSVELFLGRRMDDGLHVRAPWTIVGWPVGALIAFLVGAFRRPEDLD
jgi:hypothetical protein